MTRTKTILLGLAAWLLMAPGQAEVVFRAEPPDAPARARLMELLPSPLSHDILLRRIQTLSDNPQLRGAIIPSPVGLGVDAGDYVLWRDALGSEIFVDRLRLGQPDPDGKPLDDEAVRRVAQEFFEKYPPVPTESMALNFAKVEWHMTQEQDLRTGDVSPPRAEEAVAYLKVEFEDVLVSGYRMPVVGEDPARVVVGKDGGVRAAFSQMRRAKHVGDPILILPYSEVRESLLKQMSQEASPDDDVIVHDIEFGYFSRPVGEPQGFYQPAYVFYVSYFNKELKAETAARIIPIPAIPPETMKEPLEQPEEPGPDAKREQIRWKAEPPPVQIGLLLPAIQKARLADPQSQIRLRANQLKLNLNGLKESPRGLFIADGTNNTLLFQDISGVEFYGQLNRMGMEKPGTLPPISDQDALNYALRWLEQFEEFDPEQIGNPVVRRVMNQTFDLEKGAPGEPTADEAIVEFQRFMPGLKNGNAPIPIVGHGGFVRIHMNNLGDVSGHHWMWSPLGEPGKAEEVRPFGPVRDEFERVLLADLGQSLADVIDVEFGYYERPEGFLQDHLQPAFVFTVELVDPETMETTAVRQIPVPATSLMEPLDDETAHVWPKLPGDTREGLTIPLAYGDFDGDGDVDTQDVALTLQVAAGLLEIPDQRTLTATDVHPGGVNNALGDGSVRLFDALRIIRHIVGLDDISDGF